MKKNPKLNVRLLRCIKRHILEEPRRLVMFTLGKQGVPGEKFHGDNGPQAFPKCGTVACIAGWACLLSGQSIYAGAKVAGELLGLPYRDDDSGPADALFFTFDWPHQFRDAYDDARTPTKRAKIAADRIEHLIATGE